MPPSKEAAQTPVGARGPAARLQRGRAGALPSRLHACYRQQLWPQRTTEIGPRSCSELLWESADTWPSSKRPHSHCIPAGDPFDVHIAPRRWLP